MESNKIRSKISFRYSMLTLILLALAYIIEFFITKPGTDFFDIMVGVFVLMAGILAIIGLVNSFMGLKEPISMEKIVGITVNGFITFFFILIIIAIVIEL